MVFLVLVLFGLSFYGSFGWESLPEIPSGRRSEFYVLNENGEYKYGYDTGNGIAAKQSGDSSNQVEGHYFYNTPEGKKFDLKYSAGVQGFVPNDWKSTSNNNGYPTLSNVNLPQIDESAAHGSLNLDGSYSFGFKTNDQSREESADANNNVKGIYSYKNSAGNHDLSYVAGSETGFKPTGGSLSVPNGLSNAPNNIPPTATHQQPPSSPGNDKNTLAYGSLNADGSYSFGFKTNDQSREESGDVNNNVKGSYSYKNSAGNHDLSYVAGSETGFKPTGGSLSVPNGLSNAPNNIPPTATHQQPPSSPGNDKNTLAYGSLNADGSYSFGFKTNDQSREESGDANNNVNGSYSYKNSAGNHDLSYVAGSETGFKTTGGSLAIPNGLSNAPNNIPPSATPQQLPSLSGNDKNTLAYGSLNADGSYSFGFKTNDQSREESGDANNNVKGSYSYKNSAGNHDLSYVAGSETGFKPTGGSLAIPNGLSNAPNNIPPTATPQQLPSSSVNDKKSLAYGSLNADGSYSFGFKTNDQSREESGDANNNVKGSYSYKNSAGNHDLSYVAGSETGFKPTGGSLSVPNGLSNAPNNIPPTATHQQSPSSPGNDKNTLAYGSLNVDGSYSFGFKTHDQSREESGDVNNNVKGGYSYKNSAGNHDLSYVAGSETGFKPTGGSLAIPNGLPSSINIPPAGIPQQPSSLSGIDNNGLAYGSLYQDGSYSFSFKTADQSRQESADAKNNVKGSYSYNNAAGNHDLSYIAGEATGFKPVGGSLSVPNGLEKNSNGLQSTSQMSPIQVVDFNQISTPQNTKFSYKIGQLAVHTYLPPSNDKHKFGYILDTKS